LWAAGLAPAVGARPTLTAVVRVSTRATQTPPVTLARRDEWAPNNDGRIRKMTLPP